MSEDQDTSYNLVLSFAGLDFGDDPERAFCLGHEFGGLYERMKSGNEAEIVETIHTSNKTIIRRAASALGWNIKVEASEVEGWTYLTLSKARSERQNPHGLHVVEGGQ